MNEIITRLLDWCYEHDYEVNIDARLADESFPYMAIRLSRNGCGIRHIFSLDELSENENRYPSTKWFDAGLNYELRSFLEFVEDRFSEDEKESDNG